MASREIIARLLGITSCVGSVIAWIMHFVLSLQPYSNRYWILIAMIWIAIYSLLAGAAGLLASQKTGPWRTMSAIGLVGGMYPAGIGLIFLWFVSVSPH
jgi:hypothetical protein